MNNTALLARVSTQEQADHGYSIDEQIERMRAYCKAMNWNIYKEYIDAGFSGANTDRPALQRMIRDIKTGKVKRVLVYKLDRLSRSQKDTLELIEDVFLANGCDFVSMSENFDTSTPLGRAMIGILAVFAQLEREQIKERMTMGRVARAKQGKYMGSRIPPIGYDYINGELVTNDFEAMLVKQIFQDYASGYSPKQIAKSLNKAGMYHKTGEWNDATIRKLLLNKLYVGLVHFGDEYYEGLHEPFISKELFEQVQRVRARRYVEHGKNNRRQGRATSYLGGYIECGCCGGKYSKIKSQSSYHGSVYVYENYVCNSRSKRAKSIIKDANCKNKIWKMKELDALIFDEIKKLAIDPEYIGKIPKADEIDHISIINREIASISSQLNKMMDLYSIEGLPLDVLQTRIHDLNEKKTKLEQELAEMEQREKDKTSQEDAVRIAQSFGDILDRGDFYEIRAVISALIDKIVINGDDVTIHWTFF